jgi:hypothetical protein
MVKGLLKTVRSISSIGSEPESLRHFHVLSHFIYYLSIIIMSMLLNLVIENVWLLESMSLCTYLDL